MACIVVIMMLILMVVVTVRVWMVTICKFELIGPGNSRGN